MSTVNRLLQLLVCQLLDLSCMSSCYKSAMVMGKHTSKELFISATASCTRTPFLRAGQYAKDRTLCLLRTT